MSDGFDMGPTHQNSGRSTMLQHQVLLFLSDNPGVNVKNLAGIFLMSSASIAQLLSRLETHGFIKKEQDQNDKRVTHLYLTAKGNDEMKKIKKIGFEKATRIFKYIPEEDIRHMIRIQKNLLHQLEKEYKYV